MISMIRQVALVLSASALLATSTISVYAQTPSNSLKTAINPSNLPDMTQYGFSQATVVAPGAKTIYVAGQVGTSKDGPNDFKSQVDRAFDNLFAALKAAGGRVEDVVKITVLIRDHDMDKLKVLIDKRRAVFGESPPASTLIPVERLYTDGVLFEIDCIAVAKP
jgi:enamine deaminase RidA (YjgF/YER057c/UK114 family)